MIDLLYSLVVNQNTDPRKNLVPDIDQPEIKRGKPENNKFKCQTKTEMNKLWC